MKGKLRAMAASGTVLLVTGVLAASAADASFTSENYPATVTATSTGEAFHMFGSTWKCTESTFAGSLGEDSSTLAIKPKFGSCEGFLYMVFDFTSCAFALAATTQLGAAEVSIGCADPEDVVDLTLYGSHLAYTNQTPPCHVRIPEQTLQGIAYVDNGNGTITLSGSASVTMTQQRTSTFCPQGTHEDAEYTIQQGGIVLSGDNGALEVH